MIAYDASALGRCREYVRSRICDSVSFHEEDGMRLRTLGVLLCALLFAWPAASQEQRGSIDGVVKDTSGGILPGATVEAKSANSGVLRATTDATGSFRFPSVLPGTYVVTASM